jgi:hypothetical protein
LAFPFLCFGLCCQLHMAVTPCAVVGAPRLRAQGATLGTCAMVALLSAALVTAAGPPEEPHRQPLSTGVPFSSLDRPPRQLPTRPPAGDAGGRRDGGGDSSATEAPGLRFVADAGAAEAAWARARWGGLRHRVASGWAAERGALLAAGSPSPTPTPTQTPTPTPTPSPSASPSPSSLSSASTGSSPTSAPSPSPSRAPDVVPTNPAAPSHSHSRSRSPSRSRSRSRSRSSSRTRTRSATTSRTRACLQLSLLWACGVVAGRASVPFQGAVTLLMRPVCSRSGLVGAHSLCVCVRVFSARVCTCVRLCACV